MEGGRTKKSITNIVGSVVQQATTIILNFFARTIFIKTLGVEYLGINGLFTDILGLLSLADLGLNTAMMFSFYRPLAEQDENMLSALTTFYKKVYNIIAIVVAIVGFSLTPFVRFIVNIDKTITNLEICYLFSVMSVVISYLWVYKTSILTADQRNYYIVRVQIIIAFIKTGLQMLVLLFFESYILYLFIGIICNFLVNLIASRKAVKLYPFIERKQKLDDGSVYHIFRTLKSVIIFKLSSVLLNATDNTLISILVGTVAVGYYSNYLMINNKIISLFSVFFTSLTASIGNLIVAEKPEKRYEVFRCSQTISFIFCGIIIPCYVSLINDLISVWLGTKFCLPTGVVFVVALNLYMSCAMQPLWSYREATGLYTKTKWVMLIAAVINIILSIIFGLYYGIAGILFASVLARVVTYVWYEPILLFGLYFNKSSRSYFISLILNFLFVILTTVVFFTLSKLFVVNSWLSFFIKGLGFGVFVSIVVFVIYSRTEEIRILRKKLFHFVR